MNSPANPELPALLRPRQVAALFQVARPSIYRWVERGILPPPIRMGAGYSCWRRDDIEALLESRAAESREG